MKLKSYFATTVEAAMALARQEMGEEAMLMNSSRTPPENKHLGEYEVVFALMPAEATPAGTALQTVSGNGGGADDLTVQIGDLKRRIDRMSANFGRTRFTGPAARMNADLARVFCCLLDADVDDDIAAEIAMRATDPTAPSEALRDALAGMIAFQPTLGRDRRDRRVVAVVGPPGSGKTSTLVKLAARFGIAARRPTQIISADGFRIAAADQLRSYSAILGIGFQSVETAHALSVALDEHRHKDLVLIDTPGLSEREMEEDSGLARLLCGHPEIDVHLVLPVSMRATDLGRVVRRYQAYGPHKLIFTKLDETDSPGVVINEAVRTRLPVSFLTMGQRIPEDLTDASASVFEGLIQRVRPLELAAAGR